MSVSIDPAAIHELFSDPSGPVGQIIEQRCVAVEGVAKALLLIPGSGGIYGPGVLTFRRGGKIYSNYSTGGRSSTHQASAPGEPPASDTGSLLGSVAHEIRVEGTVVGIVGSSKDYAIYLEKGTRFMAPRPFLVPALHIVLG